MEVVYGVIRWHRVLDLVCRRHVPRRPPPPTDACLLVGLYQLLMMDTVEDYAAIHETVEAAKPAGRKVAGLVNAVLRRAQETGRACLAELEKAPLAVRTSHPDLLVRRWTGQFGEDGARRLCEWNNLRPDVTICVNLAQTSCAAFAAKLAESGIVAAPHPFAPDRFLVLPRGAAVAGLPGYAEGLFAVQDPATSAAVDLVGAQPGEDVLDACAAPGGKTLLMASAMDSRGRLAAMDSSADRIHILRENLARFGVGFATVVEGDASDPSRALAAADFRGGFDAVLLDVPCTNTGVIRRRPDARWRFDTRRLDAACARQRAILAGAASLVRPGGRLVYSTCSLEAEENEKQVEAFLAGHAEFALSESRRLFPPETGTDGAYAALLVCT